MEHTVLRKKAKEIPTVARSSSNDTDRQSLWLSLDCRTHQGVLAAGACSRWWNEGGTELCRVSPGFHSVWIRSLFQSCWLLQYWSCHSFQWSGLWFKLLKVKSAFVVITAAHYLLSGKHTNFFYYICYLLPQHGSRLALPFCLSQTGF